MVPEIWAYGIVDQLVALIDLDRQVFIRGHKFMLSLNDLRRRDLEMQPRKHEF